MRVAVLGGGSVGRRHSGNLLALGHEVVAFDPAEIDLDPGVARAASEDEAVAAAEAVFVASPSALHADQAVAALRSGRHVFIEKPMATSREDAERVAHEATRAPGVCAVGMNMRFHPALRAMKELVEGGQLGPVRLASASYGYDLRRWRPEGDYRESYSARADLGGGIVLDAVHELDYLVWLIGPVRTVTGAIGRLSDLEIDVEDTAAAVLRFESGALGLVDVNFTERAYRRGCVLVGSEATARWDWNAGTIEVSRPNDRPPETIAVKGDIAQTYVDEVADFFAAIRDGSSPAVTAQDGLHVVGVALGLKDSSGRGEEVAVAGP